LRCSPELLCVNKKGVAKARVHWHELWFKGTCEYVRACQVISKSKSVYFGGKRRTSGSRSGSPSKIP
ncbi:hypothetical protein LSAT2_032568, partial [Lamellibrachia satsuma]